MKQHASVGTNMIVVGPDPRNKQRRFANLATRRGQPLELEQILHRLKSIRAHTLPNLARFGERLQRRLSEEEHIRVYWAEDATRAIACITEATGGDKTLAINRASVIGELRPFLERSGYKLLDTYLAGYPHAEDVEKTLNHPWQLPAVPPECAFESFAVQAPDQSKTRKEYAALLGVAAASAEDGSLLFFQHTANVGTMLREARRLIVVVGLEKIVETKDDAIFQARCLGHFGLESVVLDLKPPGLSPGVEWLEKLPASDSPPEIHVILLDNGRSKIAEDDTFRELLACIGCRACAIHCPTHKYFSTDSPGYPRRYIWSHLIGKNLSLDLCTGCGMCFQKCPLDINIPRMIASVRSRKAARLPLAPARRILNDPWFLMRTTQRTAPAANLFLGSRPVRLLMERSTGLQREAWVPTPRRNTFDQWFRAHKHEHDGR